MLVSDSLAGLEQNVTRAQLSAETPGCPLLALSGHRRRLKIFPLLEAKWTFFQIAPPPRYRPLALLRKSDVVNWLDTKSEGARPNLFAALNPFLK